MTFTPENLALFFIDNFPPGQMILVAGPLGLVWAYLCLSFSGHLKGVRGVKTGYTRKVFHFSIFSTVAVLQWVWGTSMVCLFGGMTSLVILYALIRGSGHPMYEAIAREKDRPHRTFYIIAPYIATLLGGVVANVVAGQGAIIGYLVTGLGDAVGEPVGTRFGTHTYRVPSMLGVKASRSLEGTAAVFLASLVAIVLGIGANPVLALTSRSLIPILIIGLVCTLTEAVTPHGWDNATLQVVPACMAVSML
jgi:phytol kinase